MIYEYACQDCEHRFEVWAKIADPAPESCPKCQSAKLEKVIFATNFALKGSGWYTTDYKKPAVKSEATKTEAVSAKSEGSTGGTSSGNTGA